ncbi:unnamed protein product [Peronospora destructor]|uniref:Uncharacterized protein n=1 Tax=Peronospora destructor TaxID=86335 RepID=A0AAV0THE8_9STRA|nr:unnamed protein product [Peronospora destructor]
MDVSAYSNDLYEYPAIKRPVNSLCNAFVLCWENALVPTKWMRQQLGLKSSITALQTAKQQVPRTLHLQTALATVEQELIHLLTSVSNHGPLFIMSEESVQFVEATCRTFFPRLAYCLSSSTAMTSVHVVGAPNRFQSAAEKATWRVNLLQSLCRDWLLNARNLTLQEFMLHLRTLSGYVPQAAPCDTSFAIQL